MPPYRESDESQDMRATQLAIKRGLDIAIAATMLLLTSPLLLGIAAAIWAKMGRPVLYGQLRPGLHERPLRVWKFRTMTDARDQEGRLLSDGERLTRLGLWLRR